MDLELNSGTGVIHVRVNNATKAYSRLLLNSKVRVTGVSQSTFTTDGQIIDGVLLVPSVKLIEILEPSPAL